MDIVHQVPVARRTLRANAVRIDRRAHRPRMDIQRKVAVHDMDLVLIPLRQRRKKLLMHRRAIRALQIVEADNQNRSIRRPTPRRPPLSAHQQLRVFADVVLVELRQRLSVG